MRVRKRRHEENEHGPSHERWLVSYADFITLLFAFFVILFATSEQNVEKTEEFQESIKRYLIKAGAFGGSGGQINQGEKNDQVLESPLPTYKSSRPEDTQVVEVTESQVEKALSEKDREKYLIDLYSDDLGVRIVVKGAPIFEEGKATFKREALPFLNRLGQVFKKIDRRLLLEGHVDSMADDKQLAEFGLGQSRALQVGRYLSKVHQVSANKLALASFGSHRPLSAKQANLNNRIEFVVLYEDSPL
jgi:chemotaxis protein MotB